jgi:hypothetical protein
VSWWLLLLGVGLVIIALGLTIDWQLNWQKPEQRGFEVKLNPGEKLGVNRKEDDHG